MRLSAFHLTKQGSSHIKKNRECQDASGSFLADNCAIAIVCDGHGGDDYVRSAAGASFACNIALENILSFLQDAEIEELQSHSDRMLRTLEASIISGWSTAIHEDYEQHPFSDKELAVLSEKARKKYMDGRIDSAYGTTLIAVVLTTEYWFGIHIGDGKCVAVNREGRFGQPIPWDEKCFLNATTSLCDSNALENFRHFFSTKLPAAIFIGSDGIDDCFNNPKQLYSLYRTVLYSFATSEFDAAVADLSDYLPRLSAKGSGDDVSIAAVLDLDSIGELDTVKEYDREKEKAKVEERARIEAEKAAEEKRRVEAEYLEKQRLREETLRKEEDQLRKRRSFFRQRYCENCGALLHEDTRFCGACGSPVRTVLSQPKSPAPTEEQQLVEHTPSAEDSVKRAKPTAAEPAPEKEPILVAPPMQEQEPISAVPDAEKENGPQDFSSVETADSPVAASDGGTLLEAEEDLSETGTPEVLEPPEPESPESAGETLHSDGPSNTDGAPTEGASGDEKDHAQSLAADEVGSTEAPPAEQIP